ncbi:MAG: hypothetical protein U0903_11315 [Planctomycetales bacterium]
MNPCRVDETGAQGLQRLAAGTLDGQETNSGGLPEFVGQQPDGGVTGGDDERPAGEIPCRRGQRFRGSGGVMRPERGRDFVG